MSEKGGSLSTPVVVVIIAAVILVVGFLYWRSSRPAQGPADPAKMQQMMMKQQGGALKGGAK